MSATPARRYISKPATRFEAACLNVLKSEAADEEVRNIARQKAIEAGDAAFKSIREESRKLIEEAERDSLAMVHAMLGTHLLPLPEEYSAVHVEQYARVTPLGRLIWRLSCLYKTRSVIWRNDMEGVRSLWMLYEEFQSVADLAVKMGTECREIALIAAQRIDRFRDDLISRVE